MSRFLKSFDELSLELVATNAVAKRNVPLEFPAFLAQAISPVAANLLVQPTGHPSALFADTGRWHHGGINE